MTTTPNSPRYHGKLFARSTEPRYRCTPMHPATLAPVSWAQVSWESTPTAAAREMADRMYHNHRMRECLVMVEPAGGGRPTTFRCTVTHRVDVELED